MTRSAEPASVLDRMLAILDLVRDSEGPISITELAVADGHAEVLRLPPCRRAGRAAVSRADGGRSSSWACGCSSWARAPASRGACGPQPAPIIRNLWDLTGERIGLWVPRDTDMVSIAAVPGRLPMLSTRVGTRSPALTTASGKAFLAFCDDRAVVDRISAPLVEDAAVRFRSELNEVRNSAIATDNGIAYPGILAVASPVRSAGGAVIGAISIAGPDGSMDADRAGPLVRAAGVGPLPSTGRGLDADANGSLDGLGQCARPSDRRAGGVRRR